MPPARYDFPHQPVADDRAIIKGDNYRFTLLADGLLRFEWAEDGQFEDRASSFAINRKQPVPFFNLFENKHGLEIITQRFRLYYDKTPFNGDGFVVRLIGRVQGSWHYGEECKTLGGTTRTLDRANGRIPVEPGVLSQGGFAVIEDSKTMLFSDDGWVAPRRPGKRSDAYIFCYGHDYREAIRTFYAVSGNQPLLPRYALGNWWSRYHAYSDEEYLALMDRFKEEGVPLSVGVLDMEWHKVNIPPGYGNGWTGYSWERKLFPDPVRFLKDLHERDLRVTLNVHPADGIRAYEDQFEKVAKYVGVDPKTTKQIPFDCTDRKFMDAYFEVVHHEHEDNGVDFWWVDWQQGRRSRIEGIDPLWVLNHFHYLDNSRNEKRPLILSRFAGAGSHRYQIGFSGDTVMTWDSLDFQPEFTATASNIGYGWWSHDIGGHMAGTTDAERTARWVQLGCFSPILRLHSSNNIFNTREPWTFTPESCEVMKSYLRFRHRLIPYLYTMNAMAAMHGEPLIQPMYWDWPEEPKAYKYRNQYRFGSQLFVAPITQPAHPDTQLASTKAWLPAGRYVDLFTGVIYNGGRELTFHRPLSDIPVLAPEGAIIPLDGAPQPPNATGNPTALDILLVLGADGHFTLLEDDGTGSSVDDDGFTLVDLDAAPTRTGVDFYRTPITYVHATGTLTIGPISPSPPPRNPNTTAAIPTRRNLTIRLLSYTLSPTGSISYTLTNQHQRRTPLPLTPTLSSNQPQTTLLHLPHIPTTSQLTIALGTSHRRLPPLPDPYAPCWPLLARTRMPLDLKPRAWALVCDRDVRGAEKVARLRRMLARVGNLPEAMGEVVGADGRVGG